MYVLAPCFPRGSRIAIASMRDRCGLNVRIGWSHVESLPPAHVASVRVFLRNVRENTMLAISLVSTRYY